MLEAADLLFIDEFRSRFSIRQLKKYQSRSEAGCALSRRYKGNIIL